MAVITATAESIMTKYVEHCKRQYSSQRYGDRKPSTSSYISNGNVGLSQQQQNVHVERQRESLRQRLRDPLMAGLDARTGEDH